MTPTPPDPSRGGRGAIASARAYLGPALDVAWGLAAGLAVLLVAIWWSARTSEDFTDAVTGRMAFRGIGDKAIEIAGAFAAVGIGVAVHEFSHRLRRRAVPPPSHELASHDAAERAPAPRRTRNPTRPPLALALVACVGLGSLLLAVGANAFLGALRVVPPPGVVPVLAFLVVAVAAGLAARSHLGLPAGVVVAQAFFGAGAAALLPPPVRTSDGASLTVASWATPLGWVLMAAVAAVVAAAAVRRLRNLAPPLGAPGPSLVVGPAAVVGALALTAAVPVPSVPADGYHFGEFVTPAFLLADFGHVPYVDQIPARGILVNYVPAWIAEVLAGPAAGLLPVGSAGLALMVLAAAFALLRGLVGPGWAAGLTAVAGLAAASSVAVIDLVMVVLVVALYRTGTRWPFAVHAATLAGLSVVAVLLAPAQGLTFALAGTAAAGVRAFREPVRARQWVLAAGAWAVLAAVVLALSPLREMLAGAVHYVLDQGSVNDQVWGIPWADSLDLSSPVAAVATGAREVALRAAVLPALGIVLAVLVRSTRRFRDLPTLPLWFGLGAYAALQLPRALGRIDPDGLSRIGLLTLVTVGLVLPLVLLTQARRLPAPAVALGMAAIITPLLLFFPSPPSSAAAASLLASRAFGNPEDPGLTAESTVPGAAALSRAVVPPDLLDHVTSLAAQYSALLPRDAPRTMLDLTSSQADFRYLEVDNPLRTAAVFNITTARSELADVAALRDRPPHLALLTHAFAQKHDGGGLALRTPVLYEWVLATYTPLACGQPGDPGYAIWGVRDDTEPPGCRRARSPLERSAAFGVSIGATSDLLALPRAWAAPRSRVADSALEPGEVVAPVATTSAMGIDVDVPLPEAGRSSAVLAISLDCGAWTDGTITWTATPTSPAGSATAYLGGGAVLLPLGSFPSLGLSEGLTSVTIEVPGAGACTVSDDATWHGRTRVGAAIEQRLLGP